MAKKKTQKEDYFDWRYHVYCRNCATKMRTNNIYDIPKKCKNCSMIFLTIVDNKKMKVFYTQEEFRKDAK